MKNSSTQWRYALLLGFMPLLTPNVQAQNYSTSGNVLTSSSKLGSTNNESLTIVTNNTTHSIFKKNGEFRLKFFDNSYNGLVLSDPNGVFTKLNFTGGLNDVVLGNGTIGNLSSLTGWFPESGFVYTPGRVGIGGVTSPVEALEVNGNAIFNGNVSAQQLLVGDVVNSGRQLRIASSLCMKGYDATIPGSRSEVCGMGHDFFIQSTPALNFHTIMNLDNTGNVGIGTATPAYKLEVAGTAKVGGDFFVGGTMNLTTLSLSGLNTDFTPGIGDAPGILRSGIGPLTGSPRPAPLCLEPNIPFIHQINGMYHSWGYSVFGGTPNDMTMGFDGANGIIDLSGSSSEPIAPRLLINYYCGKDTYINTGASGGTVVMANASASSVVGIGTECVPSGYKFAVNGRMICEGARVNLTDGSGCWPDFVFDTEYKLQPLKELEHYITQNKHLPNVPSEKEVKENGMDLEQNDKILLQKVEELTLYLIEQNKQIEILKKELEEIKSKNN